MLLSTMHRYQSLDAWKKAHDAALAVLRTTDGAYHPKARSLFDQLRRAAVSMEANIVEGYALGSSAQFRRHLFIARGSAAEAESLARLAVELGYLGEDGGRELERVVGDALRPITGLLRVVGKGTSIR
jgi:four helix bundle protein